MNDEMVIGDDPIDSLPEEPAGALPDDAAPEMKPTPVEHPPDAAPDAPPPERRALSRAEREAYNRLRQRFAACGRCGYLIADCLLLLGEGAIEAAALDADDGWLRLEGSEAMRKLLFNAYGLRLDLDYDFIDAACPECRRRFVFRVDEVHARLKLRA